MYVTDRALGGHNTSEYARIYSENSILTGLLVLCSWLIFKAIKNLSLMSDLQLFTLGSAYAAFPKYILGPIAPSAAVLHTLSFSFYTLPRKSSSVRIS